MQKVNLTLSGLTCVSCQKLSQMKLEEIDGVKEAQVELDGKTSILVERKISRYEIEKALAGTPYKITDIKI